MSALVPKVFHRYIYDVKQHSILEILALEMAAGAGDSERLASSGPNRLAALKGPVCLRKESRVA